MVCDRIVYWLYMFLSILFFDMGLTYAHFQIHFSKFLTTPYSQLCVSIASFCLCFHFQRFTTSIYKFINFIYKKMYYKL